MWSFMTGRTYEPLSGKQGASTGGTQILGNLTRQNRRLFLFCNSLFYYSYFSFSLLKARLEAGIALAKTNPQADSEILKVRADLLEKDGSDEVWYQGNLYDVAERDRINDTIYVFLLRDEEEQTVLASGFFPDNGGLFPGGRELTATKRAPTTTDTEEMPGYALLLSRRDCLPGRASAANTSSLSVVCAETPTPPPRQV
jgi:hypothetical protein